MKKKVTVRDGQTDRQQDKVIYRGACYAPKNNEDHRQ